jgi:deoxyribodipyrimidine photo-lyase
VKQILWFRRDLRIEDSALLFHAKDEVLPIFIFDKNILEKLPSDDKRVSFIYKSVVDLKNKLKAIGLNLAIFYGEPKDIFKKIISDDTFQSVLCSCDFDSYAIKRDEEIEKLISMERFYDSFLLHPSNALKADKTPYKVFTPFYKSLKPLYESGTIVEYERNKKLRLVEFEYDIFPIFEELGFQKQDLPNFLEKDGFELLDEFKQNIKEYQNDRDYFYKDATSKLSVHLRFGLISPKQIFNRIRELKDSDFFIRELFWREFYNYILYHFPNSEHENFNGKVIKWNENKEHFKAWCEGNTGVPIIDAAMSHLNETGIMHNRLRMVVASFLTKNLFLPWQWGEEYFALKLLDYEASSNVGSWQWGASTGADSVPYFRVFNPYSQSKKFDKDGIFIKSVLKELVECNSKLFHKENGVQTNLFINYPTLIVDIKKSREEAIKRFKYA